MRLLCNEQLDIELIGLNDLRAEGKFIPKVIEDGNWYYVKNSVINFGANGLRLHSDGNWPTH